MICYQYAHGHWLTEYVSWSACSLEKSPFFRSQLIMVSTVKIAGSSLLLISFHSRGVETVGIWYDHMEYTAARVSV
jgi:hypothetical protein